MPPTRGFHITLLIACAMLPPTWARAQDAPSLPGGASSLQETFQEWRVACQIVETTKLCALSQLQAQQNGQRVLAIELQAGPDESASGNLVLPFGLLLDAGVTVQIDDNPALPATRFRTCVPAGCVVPLALDAPAIGNLRGGATLKIVGKASDTSQDVSFTVSLNGFAAALDRVTALRGG